MLGISSLTAADRDRAHNLVETAAFDIEHHAFETAEVKLRDALKIVEQLAIERAEFLAKVR